MTRRLISQSSLEELLYKSGLGTFQALAAVLLTTNKVEIISTLRVERVL